MSNTITIELCAEDRARLDRLAEALEARATQESPVLIESDDALKRQLAAVMANAEAPKEPQEAPKAETKENTQPTEEPPAAAEPEAVAEPETTIALAQIQQKVKQLAAGFNGTKKAAVRSIINAYAQKVTDLPEDKWAEVWDKLIALEQED